MTENKEQQKQDAEQYIHSVSLTTVFDKQNTAYDIKLW